MLRVGYRIRLSSGKGPDREGVVTALVGSMLRVRWPSQEETIVIPGPGTLTVLASSGDDAPSAVPPGQPAPKKAAAKKAAPKKAAPKKAAPKKAVAKAAPKKAAPKAAAKKAAPKKAAAKKAAPTKKKAATGKTASAKKKRADQDRCQEGDGQEWQRDADGREAPGSLISAARPARSPRKCCERDRDQDDTIGQGHRQLDAVLARGPTPPPVRNSGATFGACPSLRSESASRGQPPPPQPGLGLSRRRTAARLRPVTSPTRPWAPPLSADRCSCVVKGRARLDKTEIGHSWWRAGSW